MSEYRAITITQGSGGFGGPLTVEPKEGKDVLLYITGGGAEPDILPKIVELTGCRPVNGFKTSVPEEEIFLVIIDCGGTLRCGIYPQKRIPTININPVGKSGPFTISKIVSTLQLGLSILFMQASIISPKLCGGIFVA